MRAFLILLLFFLISPFAMAAQLASDGISMSGNSVSRDYDSRTVTLEGNVEIVFGPARLMCDKAVIHLDKNEVIATGNVTLISTDYVIEGSKIQYNFKTGLASVQDGFVQAGQIVFEGESVEKTGENTFFAKGAKFTSCKTCPPAWSFSGTEIEAEVGGYAYIKYPILRIVDFPIFILPRILIPLKSDRQSGLLVPSLKFSKIGGAALSLSYFWAINQSQDATITLINYANRGLKPHLEYRYVLSEGSKGSFRGAYLSDRAFSDDGKPSSTLTPLNRAFFRYEHHYEMPDQMTHRANINWVTDLRYPRDFSDELEGHGDPALENSISLTQNTETQHRSIEADYYINLLKADKLADNNDAVHRFPEFNFNIVENEIGETGLFWKFDFNYVNFARRDFGYDDTTKAPVENGFGREVKTQRDGIFNPYTDQIRTGHRFSLSPTVSYPFQISRYVEVLPSITYNETQYRFNAAPPGDCSQFTTAEERKACEDYEKTAVRRHIQGDVTVRTTYSAIFGADDGKSDRYKHEIQPELMYSVIPWAERPDHIFFGDFENQPYSRRTEQLSNNDFNTLSKVQFDYRDRLFEKRLATWVLTNHLTRKRYLENGGANYSKLVTFRLMQSYDLNQRKGEYARPWSPLNGLLNVKGDYFETYTLADYYLYAKVINWSTRLRMATLLNNFLELTYTRKVFIDNKGNADPSQKNENYGAGLGANFKYFELRGQAIYSNISRKFDGWEYVALIKPPGECWTIKFGQRQTVGSDIDYEFAFNFEFGG